jgi:hypothetical protein
MRTSVSYLSAERALPSGLLDLGDIQNPWPSEELQIENFLAQLQDCTQPQTIGHD